MQLILLVLDYTLLCRNSQGDDGRVSSRRCRRRPWPCGWMTVSLRRASLAC